MRTVVCWAGTAILGVLLATRAPGQECPDVTGCWEGDFTNGISGPLDLMLVQAGDQLSGVLVVNVAGTQTVALSGTATCDMIDLTGSVVTLSAQVTEDCMAGTFIAPPAGTSGTWQACRTACCGNGDAPVYEQMRSAGAPALTAT